MHDRMLRSQHMVLTAKRSGARSAMPTMAPPTLLWLLTKSTSPLRWSSSVNTADVARADRMLPSCHATNSVDHAGMSS